MSQTEGKISIPQIIGQPVDQTVERGENTSFSVTISDANGVTYQWKFNGVNIPGATGDSLVLTRVGRSNVGEYSVEVKNRTGSVTSMPAFLKVTRLTSP